MNVHKWEMGKKLKIHITLFIFSFSPNTPGADPATSKFTATTPALW
jgi:hypothetical protein